MKVSQLLIIAGAAQRVTYLYKLHRYEDSYAVSQEFHEWTSSINIYPERIKSTTLQVPNFNQENRTD